MHFPIVLVDHFSGPYLVDHFKSRQFTLGTPAPSTIYGIYKNAKRLLDDAAISVVVVVLTIVMNLGPLI